MSTRLTNQDTHKIEVEFGALVSEEGEKPSKQEQEPTIYSTHIMTPAPGFEPGSLWRKDCPVLPKAMPGNNDTIPITVI